MANYRSIVCAAFLAVAAHANAQSEFWENSNPPSPIPLARVCYNDTVHDWLIAGGGQDDFLWDYTLFPLYRYNGLTWDTLGLFANLVNTAVVYHDTLIVGGAFEWMRQDTISHLACYVNGAWEPYGALTPVGYIYRLRIVDGNLYALGVFQYLDGQLCNGMAKRVGGHWEPLPNWPTNFMGDPYMGDITRFQGRLVACGNFHTVDNSLIDLIQYDGNAWVPACANCLHGWMDNAGALAVYKGYLYVGGRFFYNSGNAGQGLMRWDGETWEPVGPVGEGVQLDNYSDTYPPNIYSFLEYGGRLFFNGILGYVNHIATPAVASWDGTQFCALGGAAMINGQMATSIGFYHDSLYMAHSSGSILPNLLRYRSTDFAYQCSTLGVDDVPPSGQDLHVAWSPAGQFSLLGVTDGPHRLRVYDAQGRLVLLQDVQSIAGRTTDIPFNAPSGALYVAVVEGNYPVKFCGIH